MHKYQRFSIDSAAAVGSLVVKCWANDHGGPGFESVWCTLHILHFLSDIYFLVSKILSPMCSGNGRSPLGTPEPVLHIPIWPLDQNRGVEMATVETRSEPYDQLDIEIQPASYIG